MPDIAPCAACCCAPVSKPAAAKPKVQASSSNQSQQSKPLLEPILKCDSASHVLSGTWASGLACDGYSSGSDQDSHSPVHAHLVPMLPCTVSYLGVLGHGVTRIRRTSVCGWSVPAVVKHARFAGTSKRPKPVSICSPHCVQNTNLMLCVSAAATPLQLDTVSPVTQSSDRSIPQSNSTAKDSSVNSLLAGLAAASGTSQANHDAAGLTYCGAQHLPGFPSMWGPSSSCDTLTAQQAAAIANSVAPAATAPAAAASFLGAAAGLVLLSDGDEPWQQQPCNAAGPSALQFSLTRARTSLTGAACQHALGASYCSPVFTPAPVYGIDESLASLLHSPEFAINSSSLSGDFMAAADLSSTLPQGSSGLPSLLEVIPAMSWLQLQQKEQQQQQKAMRDAAFASATRTSSGLFRTVPGQYNGLTDRCTAGGVATAAAAGVGLTGVSVALGHEEMRFDLSASAMRHIAPSLDAVSRISGARVMIEAAPRALQLRLQGGAVQLQNACQLLRMVLAN